MKRYFAIALSLLTLSAAPLRAEDTLEKGLWWLYHLQYDKARDQFDGYVHAHPDDPAGYFYLTATSWWHLAQNIEYDLPQVQAKLEADSLKTIEVAKELYDSSPDPKGKARACLYWGGAEGLWGRWLVTQKDWVKAYFAGKRGYRLLKKAVTLDPTLYDAYLGLGIYDYYTDTLSGVQAVLAAMLIHGDKERGLQALKTVLEHGEHAKVEAMCFLVEIYTSEEKTPDKALPLVEQLHKKYPQSPAMYLMKISTLFTMKAWDDMLPEAEDFLKKSKDETPWYTQEYVIPARYCIGVAKFFGKHDLEASEAIMKAIISESSPQSRFTRFAHLRLGQIYDVKGEREKAMLEYRAAMAGLDLWGVHTEAGQYLRTPFTF